MTPDNRHHHPDNHLHLLGSTSTLHHPPPYTSGLAMYPGTKQHTHPGYAHPPLQPPSNTHNRYPLYQQSRVPLGVGTPSQLDRSAAAAGNLVPPSSLLHVGNGSMAPPEQMTYQHARLATLTSPPPSRSTTRASDQRQPKHYLCKSLDPRYPEMDMKYHSKFFGCYWRNRNSNLVGFPYVRGQTNDYGWTLLHKPSGFNPRICECGVSFLFF